MRPSAFSTGRKSPVYRDAGGKDIYSALRKHVSQIIDCSKPALCLRLGPRRRRLLLRVPNCTESASRHRGLVAQVAVQPHGGAVLP
eukprot:4923250-Heterocapsa_arctica.AAC.1